MFSECGGKALEIFKKASDREWVFSFPLKSQLTENQVGFLMECGIEILLSRVMISWFIRKIS